MVELVQQDYCVAIVDLKFWFVHAYLHTYLSRIISIILLYKES